MSIAVRNNMHFIVYRCSVNIHLKNRRKVQEFDHDWRVATLEAVNCVKLLATNV